MFFTYVYLCLFTLVHYSKLCLSLWWICEGQPDKKLRVSEAADRDVQGCILVCRINVHSSLESRLEGGQFVIVVRPASADAAQRSWRRPSQLSRISAIESTAAGHAVWIIQRGKGQGTGHCYFMCLELVHCGWPSARRALSTYNCRNLQYFLLHIFNTNYCYVI